ncbi:MAG TPA: hypothetical protein PLA54_15545, partial [Spirochaetota bacterium]|nr:hypothetical protein [Spirochaetota bacterium]
MRYFKVLPVLLLASLFFSMPSEAGLIKKIKNKVTGKEEKKEEKNNPVKKDPKATAPNKALIKQLEALSNPEGINNNVKPQSLKETPLSNPVEESRKQTITSDGTPITY